MYVASAISPAGYFYISRYQVNTNTNALLVNEINRINSDIRKRNKLVVPVFYDSNISNLIDSYFISSDTTTIEQHKSSIVKISSSILNVATSPLSEAEIKSKSSLLFEECNTLSVFYDIDFVSKLIRHNALKEMIDDMSLGINNRDQYKINLLVTSTPVLFIDREGNINLYVETKFDITSDADKTLSISKICKTQNNNDTLNFQTCIKELIEDLDILYKYNYIFGKYV